MKQTFYVHQYTSGVYDGDTMISRREKIHELKNLGTITLDVEPIRKELEKVIHKPYLMCFPEGKQIISYLPMDSYDITVTYKIKE